MFHSILLRYLCLAGESFNLGIVLQLVDSGRLPWWVAAGQSVRAAAGSCRFVRRTSKSIGRRLKLLIFHSVRNMSLAPPCPGVGERQVAAVARRASLLRLSISGGGMATAALGTGFAGLALRQTPTVHGFPSASFSFENLLQK